MNDRAALTVSYAVLAELIVGTGLTLLFDLTSWSTRAHLTVVGGTLELVGLALVSMDFWWPVVARLSSQLGRRAGEAASHAFDRARLEARRLLRRPTNVTAQTAELGTALESNLAGDVTVGGRTPSLSEMVRQLYDIEARLTAVESRQTSDTQDLRERLDSMTGVVQEMIGRSKDRYLGWRIAGLAVAFSGTVFLSAANLVS